ncbi:Uncharacterised protein [Mycobacteroides abscessus subsp. abscessus]|nr:Uncharacterised protein [Mycobacteroides abscessus subsp. abscessus]
MAVPCIPPLAVPPPAPLFTPELPLSPLSPEVSPPSLSSCLPLPLGVLAGSSVVS